MARLRRLIWASHGYSVQILGSIIAFSDFKENSPSITILISTIDKCMQRRVADNQ